MLSVKLICVGKMREPFYIEAFREYAQRLSGYCRFECCELAEMRLPAEPTGGEIAAALEKEADSILKSIPAGSYAVAMSIEGKKLSSEGVAEMLNRCAVSGKSKICFIIGGSFGLAERVKAAADFRLSMSDMTFPHHLARVMLAEQIYRGFKINEGSAYHK